MRTLLFAIALLLMLSACKKHSDLPDLAGTWICRQYTIGYAGRTVVLPKDSALDLLLGFNGFYGYYAAGKLADTGRYSYQDVSPLAGGSADKVPALILTSDSFTTQTLLISWAHDTLVLEENGIDGNVFWYVRAPSPI